MRVLIKKMGKVWGVWTLTEKNIFFDREFPRLNYALDRCLRIIGEKGYAGGGYDYSVIRKREG